MPNGQEKAFTANTLENKFIMSKYRVANTKLQVSLLYFNIDFVLFFFKLKVKFLMEFHVTSIFKYSLEAVVSMIF